jgi:hypothetical protein
MQLLRIFLQFIAGLFLVLCCQTLNACHPEETALITGLEDMKRVGLSS